MLLSALEWLNGCGPMQLGTRNFNPKAGMSFMIASNAKRAAAAIRNQAGP
jgi:hypothetical protein